MAAFYADPKFMKWLAELKPWDELVMRMALKDRIPEPGTGKKWNARILELEETLIKTTTEMADLLKAVKRASEHVERVMEPDRK